jgi:energy-coupling factor transporter ATP-binding protein EcfA2
MARRKKEVYAEIEKAMAQARYQVVRATTGQMCFARPSPSGTSLTIAEFNQEEAQLQVFSLLNDLATEIEADWADVGATLALLRAKAGDALPVKVYNRVAEADDGTIYLDLGDGQRRVLEIRPGSWQESTNCPIYFNRPPSMLPLPYPTRNGQIDRLRCVLRIDDADVWWLSLGFLLSCLKERATHFLAVVQGPTGAGKSTLTRYLSQVLDHRDPQTPRIRKKTDDIVAACAHRYVMAFDNMTALTADQSGDLCAIASGSGLEGRKYYTNFGACGASIHRPMILNGIDGLLKRGEIRSRAVPIRLPSREGQLHLEDEVIGEDFRTHWGEMLGAVLELAAKGLGDTDTLPVPVQQSRMVSSVGWVYRCLRSGGLDPDQFFGAYTRAKTIAADEQRCSWSLLPYLREAAEVAFEGLAKELWEELTKDLLKGVRPADWPNSVEALGIQIAENEEVLRQAGVGYHKKSTRRGTYYHFYLTSPHAPHAPTDPSSPVAPSPAPVEPAKVDVVSCPQWQVISEEEHRQFKEQFAQRSNELHKRHPNALVYFDIPNRPIFCGRSARQVGEWLGREHDRQLLPVTSEEFERCRADMKGFDFIPLQP